MSPCTIWAGQERLGQRTWTSPGGWTSGVPQAGHSVGHDEGPLVAVALLGQRRHHLGDHVAGPLHDDPVADAQVLAGDVLLVVEGRELDRRPADRDRLQLGEGHERPGAADVHLDVVEGRGDGGRARTCRRSPSAAPGPTAPRRSWTSTSSIFTTAPSMSKSTEPRRSSHASHSACTSSSVADDADVGVHAEARPAQPLQGGGLGRQVEPLGVADAVDPDRQRPLGGGGRVELAQAAGGRVAGVGEGRQAGGRPRLVELGEGPQRQVDLAAHLDHRRGRRAVGGAQALRDRADRAQVGRDVLPHDAVAAGGALHEAAVLVGQRDREAVDLRLDHELDLAGAEPLLLHDRPRAPVPGRRAPPAPRALARLSIGAPVAHLGEAPGRRRAHPLGRRVRASAARGPPPPAPPARASSRRRRRRRPSAGRGRSRRGWPRRSARAARRRGRRGRSRGPLPEAGPHELGRRLDDRGRGRRPRARRGEKKPQVTPIVTTPAARPDSMSKGESPT